MTESERLYALADVACDEARVAQEEYYELLATQINDGLIDEAWGKAEQANDRALRLVSEARIEEQWEQYQRYRHSFDDDGTCTVCGFDGAEWAHLRSVRPDVDEPSPRCTG